MEIRDIYKEHRVIYLALNRKVFDFSFVMDSSKRVHLVWSEYNLDTEEVNFYSCICYKNKWEAPILVYKRQNVLPDVNITVAKDYKIHMLLIGAKGPVYGFSLKTYNGKSWGPEKKIIETATSTFGHNITASHRRNEIYIVYGHYNERHYFPYIFTAIFSGHASKEFGKLFSIRGNGEFWSDPIRISKRGRFSCSNPQICLCDKENILNIAWEDERRGYWKREVYYGSFSGSKLSGNKRPNKCKNEGYSPLITCDDENNVYLLWNTSENEEMDILCYREKIDNIWSWPEKLLEKGTVSFINVDNLRNIHIMWATGGKIYLKMKIDSVWSNTITFDGVNAKSFIDIANTIHILSLDSINEKQTLFTYRKLVRKR